MCLSICGKLSEERGDFRDTEKSFTFWNEYPGRLNRASLKEVFGWDGPEPLAIFGPSEKDESYLERIEEGC